MGTQPFERESSLRKPSKIGEEIRKELEKRGLRAPKSEPEKPNGNKVDTSIETPVQIIVKKETQGQVGVEVKPIGHMDEPEVVEVGHESGPEFESEVDGISDINHALEMAEISEQADVDTHLLETIEVVPDLEAYEAASVEEDVDIENYEEVSIEKVMDVETCEVDWIGEVQDIEAQELLSTESVVESKKQEEDSIDDNEALITAEGGEVTKAFEVDDTKPLEAQDSSEDKEVEGGETGEVSSTAAEHVAERIETVIEEQLEDEPPIDEVAEIRENEVGAKELPETAELNKETIEVLRSYQKVRTSSEQLPRRLDKSDAVESILSIASQELRSPLQAISGYLELLVNGGVPDLRQEEQFLHIAYRESIHLADIVADLEAASVIQTGKLKITSAPFSMDRLLQTCIQRFSEPAWEGQIFLADARLKDLPDLMGDESYLRHALHNLISSVLRSIRTDNHVFIRTLVDENDLILQITSGEENPSDTTLPDHKTARGEFYDISQEGLGIFVARHIIDAHMGVMIAQGNVDSGFSFTLQLPLRPRSEKKGTILITEDNTHAAMLMEYALERDGYLPIKATNGLEALEIIANDAIDLVILDVVLPGMDGFEICYRMRSSPDTASIPVVIVSAKTSDEDRVKALRVGADAYFNKPLVIANLLSTMESLLDNESMNNSDEDVEEVESR
jgi:CheY-like chemotaxis protein